MRSGTIAILILALALIGIGIIHKTVLAPSDTGQVAAPPHAAQTQAAKTNDQTDYGARLYNEHCAACHDGSLAEAPSKQALQERTIEQLEASMRTGIMKEQTAGLSRIDQVVVARYLGRAGAQDFKFKDSAYCKGALDLTGPAIWARWGNGLTNNRFQPASNSAFTPQNSGGLSLKWAFGFPDAVRARSQPVVTPEAIFLGSQSGTVYALDTQSGCIWWTFAAGAEVRHSPTIESGDDGRPHTLYFGDFDAAVYALDARTGALRWKTSVKDHPDGTITGSPTLHKGRLYVPMSSIEVLSAYNPEYECCTFRGGLTALDAKTGARIWRNYTVPEKTQQPANSAGAAQWGPSGAPVWSVPTIDERRGLIYVGTGQNYSSPASALSSAIAAFKLRDGSLKWAQQPADNDAWNAACGRTQVNCPKEDGPDFDFGAPPILYRLPSGKDIILAGQKSGMIYALDPDAEGAIKWKQRAGMGGFNGGVHWGMAAMGGVLYVGIADTPGNKFTVGPPRTGLHAYDIATGTPLWSHHEKMRCTEKGYDCHPALSAAITAAPDVIFAGGLNGEIHAYSSKNGDKLWTYNTRQDLPTINGVAAKGGSIDSAGPVIAGNLLIVNSGYDKFGEVPGNALLVFEAGSKE